MGKAYHTDQDDVPVSKRTTFETGFDVGDAVKLGKREGTVEQVVVYPENVVMLLVEFGPQEQRHLRADEVTKG